MEHSIIDKITCWIQKRLPEYTFGRFDYAVVQNENGALKIIDWTLEIPMPTMEEIENINMGDYNKPVVKNSIEDLILRIEALEMEIKKWE